MRRGTIVNDARAGCWSVDRESTGDRVTCVMFKCLGFLRAGHLTLAPRWAADNASRCRRTFDRVSFGYRRFHSSRLIAMSESCAPTVSDGTDDVLEGECDRTRLQEVTIADTTLQGVSVGASETCILLPGFLAFDIGRCPMQAVRMQVVAFTHMHVDHVAGLPFHLATRNLHRMPPPIYIVPRTVAGAFEKLIQSFSSLDGTEYRYEIVPMSPDETYTLKKGWQIKAFRTFHTVPSQGYILRQTRHKLKPEYRGLPSKELANLRRSGADISDTLYVPEVAVTGDTTLDALQHCEEARRAKVLVTEATFLDDNATVAGARAYGHVHMDEVAARAEELFSECSGVVFSHFSGRYSAERIKALWSAKLPAWLRAKAVPLVGQRIKVL